jgi:hypothetical protein
MVLTTLMLAAGLLTTPEPQAEPQKAWVVELRGYTYHTQAKPKGWVVELRGYTIHSQAKPKSRWTLDFQWPQPTAAPKVEPVQTQYYDDLRAVFGRLKMDVIEARYHDDLRPVFENLKKQKP